MRHSGAIGASHDDTPGTIVIRPGGGWGGGRRGWICSVVRRSARNPNRGLFGWGWGKTNHRAAIAQLGRLVYLLPAAMQDTVPSHAADAATAAAADCSFSCPPILNPRVELYNHRLDTLTAVTLATPPSPPSWLQCVEV